MEGQNQNDELYPIAVLIDELKVQGARHSEGTYAKPISTTTYCSV